MDLIRGSSLKLLIDKPADRLQRPLRDLRISVTDRCNFRCIYCMPKHLFGPDHAFLQRSEILTFEEIERAVKLFANLGVNKIRITGGEPLIRKDLEKLIGMINQVDGIDDISLTTNGALLSRKKAELLVKAGLNRLTLSLDALDDKVFNQINDVRFPVSRVLEAIETARQVGLSPVKVNMVVIKDINVNQILPMVEYFRDREVVLRFIEFMDVGNTNEWQYDKVFDAKSMVELIDNHFPIEPIAPNYKGEVAKRWRYQDGSGEIGIIASVTQPFCSSCHRARLSAEGKLYTCLFANSGYDLRDLIRSEVNDEVVLDKLHQIWSTREDRYSELRSQNKDSSKKIEMSYIGG